jgi:hypothetical protein
VRGRLIVALIGILAAAAAQAAALDLSLVETRHFAIRFGATSAGTIRGTADLFEAAYETMEQAVGKIDTRPIDVVIFAETGDFTAETGLAVWSASAAIDGAIYMQPVGVLSARGVLETAIRHEVCLVFLFRRFGTGMPAWLAEGLAVYHSGEIVIIRRGLSGEPPGVSNPAEIDVLLADRADRDRNRWGYVLAYESVRSLLEGGGAARAREGGVR